MLMSPCFKVIRKGAKQEYVVVSSVLFYLNELKLHSVLFMLYFSFYINFVTSLFLCRFICSLG